jgi:hypothetical protein
MALRGNQKKEKGKKKRVSTIIIGCIVALVLFWGLADLLGGSKHKGINNRDLEYVMEYKVQRDDLEVIKDNLEKDYRDIVSGKATDYFAYKKDINDLNDWIDETDEYMNDYKSPNLQVDKMQDDLKGAVAAYRQVSIYATRFMEQGDEQSQDGLWETTSNAIEKLESSDRSWQNVIDKYEINLDEEGE